MDKSKFKNLLGKAPAHPGLADIDVVETSGPWPLPLYNLPARKYYLGAGFIVRLHDRLKNEEFTATIAATLAADGTPEFRLSCPSTLLVTGATRRSEIDTAVETLGKEMSDPESLVQSTAELYGKYDRNGACNYASLAKNDELCAHLAAALVHLQQLHPDLDAVLVKKYVDVTTGGVRPAAADAKDGLADLERYVFGVPVLVEGDRGGGKTHDAYALARKHSYPVILMPGHEGVEAPDLLGYTVQAGAHGFVWMDGPVTAAFRKAREGKVILLLDELLRIPQRHLSALLTALTPDEYEGVYRLPTGRVVAVKDGVAETEVLTCPIENLGVIATTNVGGEYAVDECDPALRERFHVIRKDTEEDKLRAILERKVSAKGWSTAVVSSLMEFFTAMTQLHVQGNLKAAPTTRTMSRAVTLARSAKEVGQVVFEMNLQWVARSPSGKAVLEQQELVRKAVNKAFNLSIPEPKGTKRK